MNGMRPIYESEQDRFNEFDAINSYLSMSDSPELVVRKLPKQYRADFMLFHPFTGLPVKVVEVKCRSKMWDPYNMGLAKWVSCLQLCEFLRVRFALLVKAMDTGSIWVMECGWEHMSLIEPDVKWFGRTDRGDSQDMEPVVCLRKGSFIQYKQGVSP